MKNILISFIVPIYKVEKEYLETCISSLCGIKSNKVEFILVDDGSPDNCGAICDCIAKRDNRIKVYHKTNGGVSSARNYGITKSRGEYVTFVDADDWIEPNKMDDVIQVMLQSNYDLYIHGQYIDFKNKKSISVRPFNGNKVFIMPDEIDELQKMVFVREYKSMRSCAGAGVLCNATDKIIKKDILCVGECKFDEKITVFEDNLFNLKMLDYCEKVMYIDSCIYHYRMRKTSTSHSINDNGYTKVKVFVNEAEKYLQSVGKDSSYYEALYCRCYDLLFERFETAYLYQAMRKGKLMISMRNMMKELKEEPFLTAIKTVKMNNLSLKEKVKAIIFKLNMSPIFLLIKVIKRRMNLDRKEKDIFY